MIFYIYRINSLIFVGLFSEADHPERSMNGSIKAGYEAVDAVVGECDLS